MIIYIHIVVVIILLLFICYFIYFNNSKKEYFTEKEEYTAIIIEPRKHKALEFVLDNFLNNLNNKWNFIIFHGNHNKSFIINMINSNFSNHIDRITLINLNIDNLTIKDYNELLVSKDFYNNIPTEIFLIFQTDSMICPQHKDLINDYIKYDYVGAPWQDKNIGNGGLSLRRKSKMLEVIEKCKYDNINEDLYFSLSCPDIYRNKPSYEDALKFSVENVYNSISFGVHKPWVILTPDNIQNKINSCKGLDKLIELNK
jgi:hypothetical protein